MFQLERIIIQNVATSLIAIRFGGRHSLAEQNRTEQNGTGLILIAFNRPTFFVFYCRLLLVADDLKQFVYLLHVLCLIASHCLSFDDPHDTK